jgi:hypothetical protein
MLIAADYYSHATGELDKAAQIYQEVIESYPREPGQYLALGIVYCHSSSHSPCARPKQPVRQPCQ